MTRLPLILAIALAATSAFAKGSHGSSRSSTSTYSTPASHQVAGHVRKDGTYVQPHQATNRDASKNNNWSTQGNVNPYTGKEGTKPRGAN